MPTLQDPWLVAAWPGMGRVARTAGEYLAAKLDMQHVGDFPTDRFFEVDSITVRKGVAQSGRRPRCPVFLRRDPQQRHDLILAIGEAQPPTGGYAMCEQLVEQAKQWGCSRVVSLAAMATQMLPGHAARVFGAVSDASLTSALRPTQVQLLEGGQIAGMNGLMLAAAQQHGIEGICLLGEMPYFATQVPNPRASRAALGALTNMLGIDMDFTELDEQADQVDAQLTQLVEQLKQRAAQDPDMMEDDEDAEFTIPKVAEDQPGDERPKLDPQVEQQIEQLFAEAEVDRAKAYQLKRVLDQHSVFKEYEDRFLDLFKPRN